MARAVLDSTMTAANLAALALLGLLTACASGVKQADAQTKATPPVCAGSLSQASAELLLAYPSFQRDIEDGPLFQALQQRLGPPRSCVRSVQDGGLRLAYKFPKSGALVARVDPRIEFSEQHVNLKGLDEAEAESLLQAAETNTFGTTGCGIAWDQPVTEERGSFGGSREMVYHGDACNCQARVVYDGKKVIGLILRSAC
jgi:hypothetical protein